MSTNKDFGKTDLRSNKASDALFETVTIYAKSEIGGQAQTRFRSPYAPSSRRTDGQYLVSRSLETG